MDTKDLIYIIDQCLAPQIPDLIHRPIQETDFETFKLKLDSDLERILIAINSKVIHDWDTEVIVSLIILIGEQQGDGFWITNSSNIKQGLNCFYNEIMLLNESFLEDSLIKCLNKLKVKFKRESWKCYPASVSCLSFLTTNLLKRLNKTKEFLGLLLPPILLQVDDFEVNYRLNGLNLLKLLLESFKEEIFDENGHSEVILDAIKHTLYMKECEVIRTAISCLGILINSNNSLTINKWSSYDEVIDITLNGMYMATSLDMRAMYVEVLPGFLTNIRSRILLWLKRLLVIFQSYMDTSIMDNCIDESSVCGIAQCAVISLGYSKAFAFMYSDIIDIFFTTLLKIVSINIDKTKKEKSLRYLAVALAFLLIHNNVKLKEAKDIYQIHSSQIIYEDYKMLWQYMFDIIQKEEKESMHEHDIRDRFRYHISIK